MNGSQLEGNHDKTQLPFSWEHIKVVVRNAWVTLEGQVEWQYQKHAPKMQFSGFKSIKGVTNAIVLKPRAEPSQIKNHPPPPIAQEPKPTLVMETSVELS